MSSWNDSGLNGRPCAAAKWTCARFFSRVFVTALLLAVVGDASAQSPDARVDYILVIDQSGSMQGYNGSANIFPQVKSALREFVNSADAGSRIYMAPFSAGLTDFKSFNAGTEGAAALAYIDAMTANGARTHVYEAIGDAFKRYRDQPENEDRIGVVLVYTDGKDNGPQRLSMRDVVDRFGLERKEHDWLYYSTLGVELDPASVGALQNSGVATYNNNAEGTVAPIKVVQPRYGLLDFGNLYDREQLPERVQRFNKSSGMTEALTLSAQASVPELEAEGVYALVAPGRFQVDSDQSIAFSLTFENGTPPEGMYQGTLRLESGDPAVLVVPSSIDIRFRNEEPSIVKLSRPRGATGSLDLGRADPYRGDGRTEAARLNLDQNNRARENGATVMVRFEPDVKNPAALPDSFLLVNGDPLLDGVREVDLSGSNELLLQGRVSKGLPEGQYRGTLIFEDASALVDTSGLGSRRLPISIEVADRPWTFFNWLLLILLLLALITIIALAAGWILTGKLPWWKVDLLPAGAALTVEKPVKDYRQIDIGNRKRWKAGEGGDDLTDWKGSVVIAPKRRNRNIQTSVVDEQGGAQLLHIGERVPQSFAEADLVDGDRIILGPYTLYFQV